MALVRYYLIRRENREFIGPMGIDEFKRRLERMEFGMQDEVSSHCGPWIILDQKENVTKHYPDIAAAVGEGLSLSWRETTGHAQVISRQDTRRDKKKSSREKSSKNNARDGFNEFLRQKKRKATQMKIGALVVVALSAIFAGVILQKKDDLPTVAEMNALASRSDPSEFLSAMGMKVIPNVSRVVRTTKNQAAWVPLLRMYAFYTTGAVDGVPAKLLRGEQAAMAPLDCSVESWKQRWRENAGQLVQFLQGKSLNKNPWTKILSMDPNWIRRRPMKGWIKPRNFFEGCIMTASTAVRSLSSETGLGASPQDGMTPELMAVVSRRLQQQLDILSNGRIVTPVDKTGVAGAMTCLESWPTIQELDGCRNLVEGPMKPLLDEKYSQALVRVAVAQGQGLPDPKLAGAIQGSGGKLGVEDLMSRLDLSPESKLLSYIATGSSIEQALTRVDQEYPDVNFR